MELGRSIDEVAVSVLMLGIQWRPVISITPPAVNRTRIEDRGRPIRRFEGT
jgi:hypothetical protein